MPIVDLSEPGFLKGQQMYADRMQTLAQAGVQEQQAKAAELENQETEKMNALDAEVAQNFQDLAMGKRKPGKIPLSVTEEDATSITDPWDEAATIYAKGGAVGKAIELMSKTSEIRKREQDIVKSKVDTENNRLDGIVKGAELFGRLFGAGAVQNQSELTARIAEAREINKNGEVIPENLLQFMEETGYETNTMGYLTSTAISELERAKMARQKNVDEFNMDNAAHRARNADARLVLAQEAQKSLDAHRAADKKVSGKHGSAIAPTPQELASARALLKNTVYKGITIEVDQYQRATDPVFESATQGITQRAKSILEKNESISWETALNRAVAQSQADGSLTTAEEYSAMYEATGGRLGTKTKKVDFKPRVPKPLPTSQEEMVVGETYETAKGPVKWDGKKGIPVTD